MAIPLFYHASYSSLALPNNHRFPINKYQLLYQYLHAELSNHFEFIVPNMAQVDQLEAVHSKEYVTQFLTATLPTKAQRRIGFALSDALVTRTLYSVGASLEGAKAALDTGLACQISGGYHHSFPNFGSGFCIFNDLVIAAKQLVEIGLCHKVLILDLDVHQGDGSAVCAAAFPDIVTVSMHCQQNFPAKKQESDYDFALDKHITTAEYLSLLEQCLMIIRIEQPDIVLYNAGADIYCNDELGYLDICLAGVQKRDSRVIEFCQDLAIPLFTVSGGGYQRDINKLVEVHKQLYLSLIKA